MPKPQKIKSPAADYAIPSTRDEADEFIYKIGEASRDRQLAETAMNEDIAKIKAEYERKAGPAITLRCRGSADKPGEQNCRDYWYAFGTELHLAEFLRSAVGDGWRRINEDPVKLVTTADSTDIVLAGFCSRCERINGAASKVIFGRRVLSNLGKLFVRA